MSNTTDQLRVRPGKEIALDDWPTKVEPVYRSKQDYKALLTAHTQELASLQARLYASSARSGR